jgi:hypothetical protein
MPAAVELREVGEKSPVRCAARQCSRAQSSE